MIGNQSLYIYKDFLPNTDSGTHFRFTNVNDYINYINKRIIKKNTLHHKDLIVKQK